jgi:uncharacterized protein YjiS (DUF1127 family)
VSGLFLPLPRRSEPARVQANTKKDLPMVLSTLLSGINRWRRYRETVRQLSDLSDRELKDLGISRSDIASVAKGGRATAH